MIDDLDRRLIALLRANGREPVVNLAKDLGVTRATVNARIDKLIEHGVIAGFSVRVRDSSEVSTVRAIMLVRLEAGRDDVIHSLLGIPEITALHTTNGQWDLVAELSCESLAALDLALTIVRAIPGVLTCETNILLSSITV